MLAIFAHPDDETMGPGGTLAKYTQAGVRVHYLCATRGEAGTVDPKLLADGLTVAALRTRELHASAQVLGLASVSFLDYRDSGMLGAPDNQHPDSLFAAPLAEVAERIADHIRRLRPDTIITHDQYGWYGHPDHIKIYQAVLLAYELLYGLRIDPTSPLHVQGAAHTAPRLYLATLPKTWLKWLVRGMRLCGRDPHRHGQNRDIDLAAIASWDSVITAQVNVAAHVDTKTAAVRSHASQRALTDSHHPLIARLLRHLNGTEHFSRVYPPVRAGEAIETELVELPPRLRRRPATTPLLRLGYFGLAQLP
jgi:LmbE family N-acetylglucosaminyl deacetylase